MSAALWSAAFIWAVKLAAPALCCLSTASRVASLSLPSSNCRPRSKMLFCSSCSVNRLFQACLQVSHAQLGLLSSSPWPLQPLPQIQDAVLQLLQCYRHGYRHGDRSYRQGYTSYRHGYRLFRYADRLFRHGYKCGGHDWICFLPLLGLLPDPECYCDGAAAVW